jgi:hypothetical protein
VHAFRDRARRLKPRLDKAGEGTFALEWIEVNGTRLRYDVTGSGPAIAVLVHETGGTLDSLDRALAVLSNSRRVLRDSGRAAALVRHGPTMVFRHIGSRKPRPFRRMLIPGGQATAWQVPG